MIRGVCFDMGGTLHLISHTKETRLSYAVMLKQRLADYGIDLADSAEDLAQELARATEHYKKQSDLSLKELPADVIWSAYYLGKYHIPRERIAPIAEELSFRYDYCRDRIVRRQHIAETFTALRDMGCKTGIISNIISRSVVPHFLAEYGVDALTDCIVTSAQTGIRKPDPAIFRIAENELCLKPGELAYVGDTISRDVIGTRNAGWALMIRILTPKPSVRDSELSEADYPADYVIHELSEIPAIIAKVNAV